MIGAVFVFSIKLAAILLSLFLAIGWLQDFHPAFDSFSHFRHLAVALLIAVTIVLVLVAPWVWSAATIAVVALSVVLSYPFLPGVGPPSHAKDAVDDTIQVIQFNLRFNNGQIDKIAAAILSEDADVVLMQELTPLNFELLNKVKERFPYQLECNSKSRGSVALVSKHPFVKLGQQQCLRKLGFVFAQIEIEGRGVTVASFHSKWPWPQRQPFQIKALRETFSSLPSPLILAGDFNATPWSAAVGRVAALSNTKSLKGVLLSWRPVLRNRSMVLPILLPLDQVMASDHFIPVARRRMQDGGSDHLPVLTEFIWKNGG